MNLLNLTYYPDNFTINAPKAGCFCSLTTHSSIKPQLSMYSTSTCSHAARDRGADDQETSNDRNLILVLSRSGKKNDIFFPSFGDGFCTAPPIWSG